MYNDINNATKICIKLNSVEELIELNSWYIYKDLINFVNGCVNSEYPFWIVINIKEYDNVSWVNWKSYNKYFIGNKIPIRMSSCDYIYYKIYDYKVHHEIIKKILRTNNIEEPILSINYNKSKELVYENKINNRYKYVIKTEEEVKKEYGPNWRRLHGYIYVSDMDELLGSELDFNKNVEDYEQYLDINGRLKIPEEESILVKTNDDFSWYVHPYMIKEVINKIDYNSPKELVYEKNNNENCNQICVLIHNKQELSELKNLYNECGFFNNFYDLYRDFFEKNDFIYIFLNFKYMYYGWEEESAYNEYNFKSGMVNTSNSAFDDVYVKIFDFKKDYHIIKGILKNKKINMIDYNSPKELIYENKINKNYKYYIKTEEEAKKEYGPNWMNIQRYSFIDSMFDLLGIELNFDNVRNYEKYVDFNGRLKIPEEDSIQVIDNYGRTYYIHPYMIKEITTGIEYNTPRQLVYEKRNIKKFNNF